VLRFDFTGLGHSEGEFAHTDFSSNVRDLLAAVAHLRATAEAPALLIGHSLGGSAVLAAAGEVPEARAVVTLGAPADPAHVRRLFTDAEAEIERSGEAEVTLGGRPFRIRRELLEDLAVHDLEAKIAALRRPLLVLHAPGDTVVGIDQASRIFAAARHPKSFVSLDDADHLLTRPADSAWAASVIATWASRFVPEPPPPRVRADPQEVVVTETGASTFATWVQAGPHGLRADEPAEVGGTDTGPTPYGLLLAALGACTTMTLRLYADRKGLPLERASVRLRHERIHARDCERCETESGHVDRIQRTLELEGPLDEDGRARLAAIADRCPVHRTLHGEVTVETELVPPRTPRP